MYLLAGPWVVYGRARGCKVDTGLAVGLPGRALCVEKQLALCVEATKRCIGQGNTVLEMAKRWNGF